MFYHPDRYLHSDPIKLGHQLDNIDIRSLDGVKLHAWLIKAKKTEEPKGLVLFFHGNAQNISSHHFNISWITNYGYDVLAVDYRGYGLSEGKAEVAGIYLDSLAAYAKAREIQQARKAKQFIVYGQSLGGAIAGKLLSENVADLLILDSTFHDYEEIAADVLKRNWVTYLFHPLAYPLIDNSYASTKNLKSMKCPVLVIHGDRDQVVNFSFGEEIYGLLTSERKWFWKVENGRHGDVFYSHNLRFQKKLVELIGQL